MEQRGIPEHEMPYGEPITKAGWSTLVFFAWLILFLYLDNHGHHAIAYWMANITVWGLVIVILFATFWWAFGPRK
jgi:TRAP-type uncharacterized transport system fused permease subunit